MRGGLVHRARIALLVAMAALLSAAGCGGSSNDEVAVETGSLSKAEFIAKADAICKAARTEFLAEFTRFAKAHKSEFLDPKKQPAVFGEMIDVFIAPNIEGEIA